jgi:predicted MFS family arabinose efflux permease
VLLLKSTRLARSPGTPGNPQFIAGIVGPATNWRIPFVLVAAPALLLALIMVATTREPPR